MTWDLYLMLLHVKANKNDKAKAVMLTNVLATSQVELDPATPGPFNRREAKGRARPIAGMITTRQATKHTGILLKLSYLSYLLYLVEENYYDISYDITYATLGFADWFHCHVFMKNIELQPET